MRADRIEKEESVLVDVIACENPELLDTHLAGQTLDISEAGMKVTMKVEVPNTTRLGLRLEMDQKVFRLEGQVRWTRQDGEISMGIKLDPESADYAMWEQLFELSLDGPGNQD